MKIKNFVKTIYLMLLFSSTLFSLTPSQVFQMNKNSIVVVHSLDHNGEIIKQGSGVILSSKHIATNCHVIKNGVSIQIGKNGQYIPAAFFSGDIDKDICVISSNDINGKAVILGKATKSEVGETVYAIGAPQGLELSISDGIISQLRGKNPPIIQTTAAISPGSSGGGLFNSNGQLIGLTTSHRKDGQNLNFAIPIEYKEELKWYKKPFTVPDEVLNAIRENDCPFDDNEECNQNVIKLNKFDDIQKMKKAGINLDMNLLNCDNSKDCTQLAKSLIALGIDDINIGPYQINYHDYPINNIQEYFVELFAREHVKKILTNFVEKHEYSWKTLARYRFSPEIYPKENEEYYFELYQWIHGDFDDINNSENFNQNQEYIEKIKQIVETQTITPPEANKLHQWGEVVIQFTLTNDGIVDKIKVKKSSGFNLLDTTARKIIKSSANYFPKPYQNMKIEIPLIFKDKRRPLDSFRINKNNI